MRIPGQTVVITPPEPLLSAATARSRLGLSLAVADEALESYIAAATSSISAHLGRSIGTQTLEWQSNSFPGGAFSGDIDPLAAAYFVALENGGHERCYDPSIRLSLPPAIEIVSVTYADASGADQVIDSAGYVLDAFRTLTPAYGMSWPAARWTTKSVRVRYTAGYADGNVPPEIVQAIMLSVAATQSMMKGDALLRQDTVVGVSSQQWETAVDVSANYDQFAARLVKHLRVFD